MTDESYGKKQQLIRAERKKLMWLCNKAVPIVSALSTKFLIVNYFFILHEKLSCPPLYLTLNSRHTSKQWSQL
jgi:hypothetical protein